MFDATPENDPIAIVPATPIDKLRSFVDTHRDALFDAAGLLGGRSGIRSAQVAIDGLWEIATPSRQTMRAFDQLLDLLMLEHVHVPDCIEAELFAAIDPESACVEEICFLADQLSDMLVACLPADSNASEGIRRRAAA